MVEEDRIRVDEPLISTDVDNLIRVISEKKKISLGRLRSVCKMDRRTLDKWVGVLEDEGYISVVYGLTGAYVVWSGKPAVEGLGSGPQTVVEKKEKKPLFSFFSGKSETREEPEEKLDRYLSKKGDRTEISGEDARENILESLAEEVEEEPREPDLAYVTEVPDIPEIDEHYEEHDGVQKPDKESAGHDENETAPTEDEPDDYGESDEQDEVVSAEAPSHDLESVVFGKEEEEDREQVPEVHDEPASVQPDSGAVRDLVEAYVSEIRKEKGKLVELKKRQQELYREKLVPLEEKMETDIVSVTERIMELQARMEEIKEGVLELPGKVNEVEGIQEEMSKLGREARAALVRTREQSDVFVSELKNSQTEVRSKIDSGRGALKEEEEMVEELERVSASLGSRSEKIRNALEGLKVQISEIDNTMKDLLEDLEGAADMKNQVTGMVTEVQGIMEEQARQLEGFEEELASVESMERWVKEYVEDYERKIGDIEDYVLKSGDDLKELKLAAEKRYMGRYLAHLEDMTKSYNDQLGVALDSNREMDEQIAETKDRISELLRESQEMVEKLRGEVAGAEDFPSIVTKKRKRAKKVKSTIEEKGSERKKLREDIKQKRKKRKSSKKRK